MTKMADESAGLQAETRSWMKDFARATALAALAIFVCFSLLLWITSKNKYFDWIRVDAWQHLAAGLALLALPVAFAGSYVVIKIAQLATTLAEKQRQQIDRQTQLFESQVRLQAHQLLHDDLAAAGERAEIVIAWRLAWRRALNRFWGGLEQATMPRPFAGPQSARSTGDLLDDIDGRDDDIVPAGRAFSSEFEVTPEEQVKEWEAACAKARATVSDSLRELRRLAQKADAMSDLDGCLDDHIENKTSPFAILSFLHPAAITSAEYDEICKVFAPSRVSDLLSNLEGIEYRLKNWWSDDVGDTGSFGDIAPIHISLFYTMRIGLDESDEEEWAESARNNYRALCRLFGYPGALFVSLLAAVAESPEASVIRNTLQAAENTDRVAQHVRLAFARAGIDEPLRPEIEDWVRSLVTYARQDPRRLTTIPEEEWPIADQEGWERSLSTEACRIIFEIKEGRRPNRKVDARET